MTDYIIKSSLCLTILLALYHLFLENERMHRFNRIFLLFSLIFGLLTPQLNLFTYANPQPMATLLNVSGTVFQPNTLGSAGITNTTANGGWISFLSIIYLLGVCVLFARFAVNISGLLRRVKKARIIQWAGISIALVKDTIVPHSFLNYLFLEHDAYMNKRIPNEIIAHELTHLRQKHSYDILFLELLKIIFWFNPIFVFYKKAIQLNHEFLADESVIASSGDVNTYQNILLETAALRSVNLANNLNYSLTKKRLQMMKKHTSTRMIMLKKLALIPLFTVLIFLFSDTVAQQKSPILKDEFYKGAEISSVSNGTSKSKTYEEMSAVEQNSLPQPFSPSRELINKWKAYEQYPLINNSSLSENKGGTVLCRIFIDGENVPSKTLDQYRPSDFGSYHNSKYTVGEFTLISVNLYTTKYIRSLTGKAKGMIISEGQTFIGRLNPPFIIPED
jgi:hypothetical protein